MDAPNARTIQEHGTKRLAGKGRNEMAIVRRLVGSILVALIVIAGHASARTMSNSDSIHRYLTVNQGSSIATDGANYGTSMRFDVNGYGHRSAFWFSDFAQGYVNVAVLVYGSETVLGAFEGSTGRGRFDRTYVPSDGGVGPIVIMGGRRTP